MVSAEDVLRKYGRKIENEIATEKIESGNFSREFAQFKEDMMPNLSRYERWCKGLGSFLALKLAKKDEEKVQKYIDIAHLDISPSQAVGLAISSLLVTFFVGVLVSVAIFLITEEFPFLFLFLVLITSMFLFYYVYSMPSRMANSWRLKASSQMVPCILYIVAYMKHTSNLERAVSFASQHLQPPLALDFKKIFWDVETGRYSNIKDSLDSYLETWRGYSIEFIEAFHLIESSLYESSEERRIATLERALQTILDGVYEKMLKYTHDIRSPLTNLYMLGIVLPTLGLALLPLASTLLSGMIQWYHVFLLFNLIIPFFVFYMTNEIMLKRPGGYGEAEVLELSPLYAQYKSKKPYLTAFLICFPILLLGTLPFIFQIPGLMHDIHSDFSQNPILNLKSDYTFSELGIGVLGNNYIFDFKKSGGKTVGPFGLLAVLLSLLIPVSIAMFFAIAFKFKTRELIKTREQSKQLEQEFAGSLFQLGNRLGDGMPAEIAFSRVAESSRGLVTENFFKTVNINLQSLGMSLEQAIFNPRRGAITYYPSALISTSMKILIESVKKGLQVAARSLMSISEYVKNIHKINERLRDLLAEVVSDMKSNMTFLAPLLAGIVVGLGSMIVFILNKLSGLAPTGGEEAMGMGNFSEILSIFNIETMIPPYFLQLAIGIYIIEIVFIMTKTLVTVDSGEDKLKNTSETGKNLVAAGLLYLITSFIAILALSLLVGIALGGIGG
ncbi:MAG: hypothetical protein KKB21_03990 [Nanoarchaeota archaeon]|nr:hypothetical protein [Nanoarchaeota archaeon]MBU4086709.1 hypothetical protein [Nanoarchaeota archaeon]